LRIASLVMVTNACRSLTATRRRARLLRIVVGWGFVVSA
jgi:hypothetical protein